VDFAGNFKKMFLQGEEALINGDIFSFNISDQATIQDKLD
jgi:hypothetical protein